MTLETFYAKDFKDNLRRTNLYQYVSFRVVKSWIDCELTAEKLSNTVLGNLRHFLSLFAEHFFPFLSSFFFLTTLLMVLLVLSRRLCSESQLKLHWSWIVDSVRRSKEVTTIVTSWNTLYDEFEAIFVAGTWRRTMFFAGDSRYASSAVIKFFNVLLALECFPRPASSPFNDPLLFIAHRELYL